VFGRFCFDRFIYKTIIRDVILPSNDPGFENLG
jgi:hypothetical protein